MNSQRIEMLASATVLVTGLAWGLYWVPVRALEQAGLTGAWGTVAITAAAILLLLPVAALHRRRIARASPLAIAAVALGGAAFALYSVGLIYGRVAIIILLYFLTPVWSTLIGRFVMGWHTPRMRIVAIVLGLLGLVVMLSAEGGLPLPRSVGEWIALIAGFLWSVATTGIRVRPELAPLDSAFLFALGAAIAALLLAWTLPPVSAPVQPDQVSTPQMAVLAFATGAFWWVLSIGGLMWATVRLEPARVGILLMIEVLVGAISAALFAGEHLHPLEVAGGALVLIAGVAEVWPVRDRGNGPLRD